MKTEQDLTYLQWDESSQPSGLGGIRPKAREGNGPHAVFYKMPYLRAGAAPLATEGLSELISMRLMKLLGIDCAPCQLVNAKVTFGGLPFNAWVVRSKSYRREGEQAMPFDMFWELSAQPGEEPLDFCVRMGWERDIALMMLADYLTATRGRDGAALEVLRDARGNVRLAPLRGLSRSLARSFTSETWKINACADIDTDNFIGSRSLEKNLQFVMEVLGKPTPPTPVKNIRDATTVLPVILPGMQPYTTASLHRALLQGTSDIVLHGAYLEGSWQIVKRRWERYAHLCDL